MFRARFPALLALVLVLAGAMVAGAGTAQAQGLNFRDYIEIDSLGKGLSAEMVLPGETFYADLSTEITWIGDSDPPLPISALKTWSVTALYQIAGIAKDGSGEQVLGSAEMTIGPFPEVKAGDKFDFEQHVPLVFPEIAALNDYTVVVRPVGVRGGFLNMFAAAWPLIKGGLPQEYAIGAVSLVAEMPTPTPTVTPTPQPTLAPVPTPAPGSTATPEPTATAKPVAVLPTPATPQETPAAGQDWLAPLGATLAVAFIGLVVGASIYRRLRTPGGL